MNTELRTTTPAMLLDDRPDELALLTREFVQRDFPRFQREARADPHAYPRAMMAAAAEVGLLGLEILPELEGNAVPSMQQAAIMEELAAGDAGLALDILVQNSLTAFPIARFGTEGQKARYLPRMARGE